MSETKKKYLCPACETVELQQRREAGVPFVGCSECFGAFFSVSHLCAYLMEVLEDPEAEPEFMHLLHESLAKDGPDGAVTRKCIVCSMPLQRFGLGEHPLVIADRCHKHGLWLDNRDVPRIERQIRACLRLDDAGNDQESEEDEPKKAEASPNHRVLCPNCHRRYPDEFADKRCEDCNVAMYLE